MTRDDITRMAREAGLTKIIDCCGVPNKFCGQDQWKGDINAFAALVAAAEREACAKVCETYDHADPLGVSTECAAAIRARGETK
jgi:hypothetical protein